MGGARALARAGEREPYIPTVRLWQYCAPEVPFRPWLFTVASPACRSHEAFALAFREGERFFHWLALHVARHHLGQRRLRVDLLRDLRRGCRGRN
jgi:hypothetical protein